MQEGTQSPRRALWLVAALIAAAGLVGFVHQRSQKPVNAARAALEDAKTALAKDEAGLAELKSKSAAAFLSQADLGAIEWRYGEALNAVQKATGADPSVAEAWLLQAQLLAVQEDYAEAAEAAGRYHQLQPEDPTAEELLTILRDAARTEFPNPNGELAKVFREQGQHRLAEVLLQAIEGKCELYRQRLADVGLNGPYLDPEYHLGVGLRWNKGLTDLSALRGVPLHSVDARRTSVTDLSPLRGLPLRSLDLAETPISDLSPLAGLPLESLNLDSISVTDLSPLKGMPLRALDLSTCRNVSDLSPLAGTPLEDLSLYHTPVTDLTPLEGMRLKSLVIMNTRVADLSPLEGMPLTKLNCTTTGVSDLAPLKGMPLRWLNCTNTQVGDLSPLEGAPLEFLNLSQCPELTTLHGLEGARLSALHLKFCPDLRDLSALKGMPLKSLALVDTGVTALAPLAGLPLTDLEFQQNPATTPERRITDVTPLADLKLRVLRFSPGFITKGIEALRAMDSLKSINGMSPAEFWRRYDAGEFKPGAVTTQPAPPTPSRPQPPQPTPTPPAREPTEAEKELAEYRAQLAKAWPETIGKAPGRLRLDQAGKLVLDLIGAKVEDLTPVAGLPLAELNLGRGWGGCPVKSLKPLEGAPLEVVRLKQCRALKSLDGLQGAKLKQTHLDLGECTSLEDLSALKGQNLTSISLHKCESLKSLKGLEGMKLERIDLRVCRRLVDISALQGAPLTGLNLEQCNALPSLKGLEGMKLTKLNALGCHKLADISALKGLRLVELNLRYAAVADISALAGMPLKKLTLNGNVKDLSPLRGMELEELISIEAPDLSPRKGMPLKRVMFIAEGATDLSPLKGAPLEYVLFWGCKNLQDLSPLQGSPLKELHFTHSTIQPDLSVLADLKLEKLEFDPTQVTEKGLAALRAMDSLRKMNPGVGWVDAAEFWKQYDAGEFRRPPIHTALKAANPDYNEWGWFPTENGKIVEATIQKTGISDLSPLKAMPLHTLDCPGTPVADLTPLAGKKLAGVAIHGTKVTDLTPLADSGMEHLRFSPQAIKKGMEVIRGMKTLKTIAVDDGKPMSPAEFWKEYDAGGFR